MMQVKQIQPVGQGASPATYIIKEEYARSSLHGLRCKAGVDASQHLSLPKAFSPLPCSPYLYFTFSSSFHIQCIFRGTLARSLQLPDA